MPSLRFSFGEATIVGLEIQIAFQRGYKSVWLSIIEVACRLQFIKELTKGPFGRGLDEIA